jgi:hypothetical protein
MNNRYAKKMLKKLCKVGMEKAKMQLCINLKTPILGDAHY